MNISNSSDATYYEKTDSGRLNLYYTVCEVLVAIFAVVGNAMVILVFRKERRLRRRTNYYIVSLAAADFLVGLLGIPFAIMASVGLPSNLYACLFTVSLLVVLCTISIFCLVAVSVDRYWAILHPMGYSRNVRTKTALVIIGICWFAGSIIGFLPLMGWYNADRTQEGECYFLDVVDMNYLVFLYFGTIITPALILLAFYAHIYQVVLKQLRQIVTISPTHGTSTAGRSTSGGTMLRMLGAAQKREVKATQNLSIIVLFFMICWIPLYTINCVIAFCDKCKINSTFMLMCIILSHANSAGNPLLYAYHLKDFREALKHFICDLFHYENSGAVTSSNAFTHYRLHSLRESRTYNFSHQRKYIESPIYLSRTTKSMSLPTPPKLLSIVPNSIALAAATAVDKEMWRISEVPSIMDNSNNDSSGMHTRPSTPFIKANSSSSSIKNCSYLNDINYDEDDDVFLDDTLPISDFNCEGMEFQNNIFDKLCEAPVITTFKQQHKNCLSSSSPQLSRNLFLIDTEPDFNYKSVRCNSTTDKSEFKKCPTSSMSGEYIYSPSRNIKMSPLKMVGEYLWNASKYPKSASLSDDSNVSPKYKRKNNGSVYIQDNHSFHC